jgi:hypothetical protein
MNRQKVITAVIAGGVGLGLAAAVHFRGEGQAPEVLPTATAPAPNAVSLPAGTLSCKSMLIGTGAGALDHNQTLTAILQGPTPPDYTFHAELDAPGHANDHEVTVHNSLVVGGFPSRLVADATGWIVVGSQTIHCGAPTYKK